MVMIADVTKDSSKKTKGIAPQSLRYARHIKLLMTPVAIIEGTVMLSIFRNPFLTSKFMMAAMPAMYRVMNIMGRMGVLANKSISDTLPLNRA